MDRDAVCTRIPAMVARTAEGDLIHRQLHGPKKYGEGRPYGDEGRMSQDDHTSCIALNYPELGGADPRIHRQLAPRPQLVDHRESLDHPKPDWLTPVATERFATTAEDRKMLPGRVIPDPLAERTEKELMEGSRASLQRFLQRVREWAEENHVILAATMRTLLPRGSQPDCLRDPQPSQAATTSQGAIDVQNLPPTHQLCANSGRKPVEAGAAYACCPSPWPAHNAWGVKPSWPREQGWSRIRQCARADTSRRRFRACIDGPKFHKRGDVCPSHRKR